MALDRRPSWGLLLLLLLLLSALAPPSVVAIMHVRSTIRRGGTASSFKHIEVAMECYCQDHGCYPPQYLTDRHGRPAHSWRVLLLPYLGYGGLYCRYHFDEPWNGPYNRLLATEMPEEYRSPFLGSGLTITQYVGIAGEGTPWRGAAPLRAKDLERGESDPLIWYVEAANSDINWMEPRDIPLEQALVGINVPGGRGVQSNYPDGLPAQMKPSGCRWIPPDIAPGRHRAMLTVGPKR